MKENQDTANFYSESFTMGTDHLTLKSKEIYVPDNCRINFDPPAFEEKVKDENGKDIVAVTSDNESGTIDSPRKDDQGRLLDNLRGWERDYDQSSQVTHEKESRSQISIKHESLVTVKDFTLCNEDEYSISQRGASGLSEPVRDVFTDKNVLEYELLELEVMKDIWVDNEKIKGALSIEVDNSCVASQCEAKEDNDGKSLDHESLKSSSFGLSGEGTAKNYDPLGLLQIAGEKFASTNNPEEDSAADEKFPIQEYGTRDSLRSLLDSLDGEGNKPTQLPDQVPIQKSVPDVPNELSSEDGKPDEEGQPKNMLQDINVETRIITSNFSDAEMVQCTSSSTSLPHQQSPTVEDKNPDFLSANSKIHPVCSKIGSEKNACEQHKEGNSDDSCPEGHVQFSGDKSHSPANDNAPAVKPDEEKQEHGETSNGDTPADQLQYEQGETSFSAVTYSGPIALSGSLSHRSDASTTSTRSFAFPILQPEWNSSPGIDGDEENGIRWRGGKWAQFLKMDTGGRGESLSRFSKVEVIIDSRRRKLGAEDEGKVGLDYRRRQQRFG
ncbi:18S pre-ribosomal assembly protein gar2-related [Striga hermonthica]|uniref:18S pre-ribosomal assembly protein gar2-related n=1 Tax=Striga hermonthica TaxID=68872 RepID=A0A9N7NFL8_STRHE|nr:18S pre-ribosomal assembly protein gar2-related [Striga hermonthica]